MSEFWKSDTYAIIKAMKRNGNRPGLIAEWKDAIERWAMLPENVRNADAAAVRTWLPAWQPRPFYTAAELAPLWPALAVAVEASMHLARPKSSMRLANELDFGGLPRLWLEDSRASDYFIVERIHHWAGRMVTVEEFRNALG